MLGTMCLLYIIILIHSLLYESNDNDKTHKDKAKRQQIVFYVKGI